ncbi:hypothetical protein [Lysinibacillus fusiformis]|uniref:hypothetical protein n=1 Tax=Lysinibacillus fusiformis TaxID=28031 RepID=UPI0023A9634F|nr:hypothetical protein [Lysinibacillus fusiformis]WEA41181.1 hypothetical protein PWJ66_09660 [Lysinibacillus fusiformis]
MVQRQPTLNVIAIGLLVLVVVIPIAGLEKTARIIVTIVIMNRITEGECANRFKDLFCEEGS